MSLRPTPTRPMPQWVALTPVLVLAIYLAMVISTAWNLLFGAFVLPMGDNAADDLLISDALHLHLLHGNYSRVGFYHPGPWFQYVAAAGELVFHDWTGIFSSYFAGQVFAISLTQGVALTLAYRLALLVSSRISVALVAVLILAATIALPLRDANPFIDLWNPYSYIGASTLVATGLAGMVLRGPSWMPLLVLGCSALVHGHASFLGLVPMMLVVAVLTSSALRLLPFRPWDYRAVVEWALRHRGPSLVSLAIIALFVLPMALDLILHWPGQFPDYVHFARLAKPQPIGAALLYVVSFIPSGGLWALLLLVPAGPAAEPTPGPSSRSLRSVAIVVMGAGFVPACWYAWKGIDNLSFQYLLLWFTPFSGVALVATLGFWLRATSFGAAARTVIALASITAAITVLNQMAYGRLDKPANFAIQRTVAQIMATPPPPYRTALFLDPVPDDDAAVWGETVSLLAALKRAKRHDFCIAPQSWHVLFTAALRCDPAREHLARVLEVTTASLATGNVVLRLGNDVITEPAPKRFPALADVPTAINSDMQLDSGWARIEAWGVWSLGPTATLSFDARRMPAKFRLTLNGQILAPTDQPQTIRVLDAQGRLLGATEAESGVTSVTIEINRADDEGRIQLQLQIGHPVQPSAQTKSADNRPLGFGLLSVQVIE